MEYSEYLTLKTYPTTAGDESANNHLLLTYVQW